MNTKVYIRFTDDIDRDIENKFSYDIHGNKLNGLCAWNAPFFYNNGRYEDFNGNVISLSELELYAKNILNNTYGSYSDNESFSIISGSYAGNGNDGVLLTNVEEIETIYL